MDCTHLLAEWGAAPTLPWQAAMAVRLVVAAVLGGLIGLEREISGRSAGLRTQMLVAMGAALTMIVSLHFAVVFDSYDAISAIRIDPARVAYGVMTGVGFLGAGAIIQRGAGIRGITTAASLWCTAAVGLACGFGMYLAAGVTTLLVLFALIVLRLLYRTLPQSVMRKLTIRVEGDGGEALDRYRRLLGEHGIAISKIELRRNVQTNVTELTFQVRVRTPRRHERLLRLAAEMSGVQKVAVA